MVLGAVASTVAGAVLSNWDVPGFNAGIALTGRENTVAQEFEKRFRAWDYRIQKQQLHREDVRDLTELTVGRMDLYHVVGTLLLSFCMSWYTDNAILSSGLPTWYVVAFLISNFGAVGYLIFSVWLAMHASIAAQSVGVRLLTSYTRLSIPNRKQLDNIKVAMYPFVHRFLELGKQAVRTAVDKAGRANASSTKTSTVDGTSNAPYAGPTSLGATSFPAGYASFAGAASVSGRSQGSHGDPGRSMRRGYTAGVEEVSSRDDEQQGIAEVEDLDDQEHFRRFLVEQRKWLSYDAYARVCMSCGMNQMLQALSYYILGVVWKKAPAAALVSFLAVKLLAGLLLILDIQDALPLNRMKDWIAFIMCYMFPPVMSCVILWAPKWGETDAENGTWTLAIVPVFLMHGSWFLYTLRQLREEEGDDYSCLPTRLRTVYYLNVIDLEQRQMAKAVREEYSEDRLVPLRATWNELHKRLEAIKEEEVRTNVVSQESRASAELQQLCRMLQHHITKARSASMGCDKKMEDELHRAQWALDRYSVWMKAPEILATLEALRAASVTDWLSEEEQNMVENSYHDFLKHCDELELGITVPVTAEAGADPIMPFSAGTLQVSPTEQPTVRVDAYGDLSTMPASVYIDTRNNEIVAEDANAAGSSQEEQPIASRVTSFGTAMALSRMWESSTARLRSGREHPQSLLALQRDVENLSSQSDTQDTDARAAARPSDASHRTTSIIPSKALPPDRLPGALVRSFMKGTACWWVIAAFSHVLAVCFHVRRVGMYEVSDMLTVNVHWPEPAGFFNVDSLYCSASQVWVANKYATFTADRLANRSFGGLAEVSPSGMSAILCDKQGCHGLMRDVANTSWTLTALPPKVGRNFTAASVALPASWRLVTAAWAHCGMIDCDTAWLAGWDGDAIVVATLQWDSTAAAWDFHMRFDVTPGRGRCATGNVRACSAFRTLTKYDDVRALHMGAFGRTLSILGNGGFLDTWDLHQGKLLDRWQVHKEHSAMCGDGREFLLARPSTHGPIVEALQVSPMHSGGCDTPTSILLV